MDEAPQFASPADIERRSVWLAVAAGFVLVLRSSMPGLLSYGPTGHLDRHLWLFILSIVPLGAAALLAGLVALPELLAYPARISTRWNPVRLYGWAVLLFILGVVLTTIAGVVAAGDLIANSPFNQ